MGQQPQITIVIPTHNRYGKLRALLSSLQDHQGDEVDSVVVVDDSDRAIDIELEFPELQIRHIVLPSRMFITKSKNIGWKMARTDYVYFIDDDNVIDGTTIPPVYATILESEQNGAVAPAVLYKTRPDLVWVYATPFMNSRLRHNLVGRNQTRNPSLENRLLRTDALPNASLVRRRALEEVNGFDERLMVNSSMDLAIRLKAKGWRVVANTGAFIYHDVDLPGKFGWWAAHGNADPRRVRYEIRDWFLIMKMLHGKETLFVPRTVLESSRFVIPNLASYALMGGVKSEAVRNLLTGYIEGLFS